MSSLGDYIAIKGKPLRKVDLANWKEDNYLAFFQIVNFLTEDVKNDKIVKVTHEKLVSLEKDIFETHNPAKVEVIYRIDQMTKEVSSTPRKFYGKLAAMIRTIGNYIKENPSIITDELYKEVSPNPRINWMLRNFKSHVTTMGVSVVVPSESDTTSFIPQKASSSDPQVKLFQAMDKLFDVYITIINSLTKKDLKEMEVKDKIAALSKLAFIMQESRKVKPNVGVLNQLNIHKAEKEDIEEALLNFSKTQQ